MPSFYQLRQRLRTPIPGAPGKRLEILPAFTNFRESQRHYQGLVKLARELPNHPILRFTPTQWALEYGDPAQQG